MKRFAIRLTLSTIMFVMAACGPSRPARTATPIPDGDMLVVSFSYTMDERFGRDDNANDMLDLPNTCEYVHNLPPGGCANGIPTEPTKFNVTFNGEGRILTYLAGQPLKKYEFVADTFKWDISGPGIDGSLQQEQSQPQWSVSLQEGEYTVTLTVEGHYGGGQTAVNSFAKKIKVIDMLIVSIGDSYASGEGNPDKVWVVGYPDGLPKYEPVWADDGVSSGIQIWNLLTTRVGMDHYRSHRSTLAGPAQAALAIEHAQAHSSVTFVSTAASGATISKGLLGTYDGIEDPFQLPDMDAQIDQVKNLVENRTIDYLFVSIGGNDIGFTNIIKSLILHGGAEGLGGIGCVSGSKDPDYIYCLINIAIHDGNWNHVEDAFIVDPFVNMGNTTGLDELNSHLFSDLNQAIKDKLNVDAIWITSYPDPFYYKDNNGQEYWCPEIMGGITSLGKVDLDELKWAQENALLPLNQAVHDAAEAYGWNYVDEIENRFKGHGYCADQPYAPIDYPGNPFPSSVQPWPTSSTVRWFRHARESVVIQDGGDRASTTGTMHPNEFGHQAIKEELSGLIIELLNRFNPP